MCAPSSASLLLSFSLPAAHSSAVYLRSASRAPRNHSSADVNRPAWIQAEPFTYRPAPPGAPSRLPPLPALEITFMQMWWQNSNNKQEEVCVFSERKAAVLCYLWKVISFEMEGKYGEAEGWRGNKLGGFSEESQPATVIKMN